MSSEPLDDEEIRRRLTRAPHTAPGIEITLMIRTNHGQTEWVPVPGDRYEAVVTAASCPAVPAMPTTPVGKRVKSMPGRRMRGTIDSVNTADSRLNIAWDDGTTATYRYGDLGVTWAYAPDRTTSTTDKEG